LRKDRPASDPLAPQKRGIGFYSYNQIKYTRPVGRIGAMLVGGIYVSVGFYIIVHLIDVRKAEARIWGSSDPHAIGFIFAVCLIGIGAFAVHVGVIYYWQKLWHWAQKDHSSRRLR
jgi:hypothetical protein